MVHNSFLIEQSFNLLDLLEDSGVDNVYDILCQLECSFDLTETEALQIYTEWLENRMMFVTENIFNERSAYAQ